MFGHPGHSGCNCQGSQHMSCSQRHCRFPVSTPWSEPVLVDRKREWGSCGAGGRGVGQRGKQDTAVAGRALAQPHSAAPSTHVVSQLADPAGEPTWVSLEPALLVPGRGHPAVVDADELVACVPPALGSHHIGNLHEELLAGDGDQENSGERGSLIPSTDRATAGACPARGWASDSTQTAKGCDEGPGSGHSLSALAQGWHTGAPGDRAPRRDGCPQPWPSAELPVLELPRGQDPLPHLALGTSPPAGGDT